ncbi:hypothetical protein H4R99_000701 [Coemansia sp. RSA 1722]|nr:hypothetical protein IWW45_000657 [Coemansia sp. RSA 485]KAJ2602475.1 hypothetical protein GGF39_000684 [Coemansia sp. RSA 1721]KAJ2605998.1 hypothetical protein H4R99_000701 [Coemansia sp. RSA 1722]KAJ2639613.1 hypothetical protein GGF40_000727 [Coemansia sp. RSA 1286]
MDDLVERLGSVNIDSEKQLESLPGLETAFQSLLEVVQYPITHRAKFKRLNIDPPKGVLLYGPPGVGKTHLVREICKATKAHLTLIQGPEILGPYLGESESQLREKFREAQDKSNDDRASVLFIDEIDSIAINRMESNDQGARLVAQLLTLMDGLESRGRLVVVGATNRPNSLDPALRRPGRFDREISIDVPGQISREKILRYCTRKMPLDGSVDFDALAESTNGYVGADLSSLCVEAATRAVGNKRPVSMDDFIYAMGHMVASTRRGLGIDVATTKWEDVGGLQQIKEKLQQAVQWPLERAATMRRLGIKPPRGVLLYGPPGCSKTTLVKVIATQTRASFFSLSGASIYSAYVGDSEKHIREIFRKARASAPSVLFFDEIEAMVGKRTSTSSGDSVQERVLSTMLNEMDGVDGTQDGVLVVGATNRIDLVDAALLRPGRFDRVVYVPPPDEQARREILGIRVKSMKMAEDVDLDELARWSEGFSGADLANLAREAAMLALRRDLVSSHVTMGDFDSAKRVVQPSLNSEMMSFYKDISEEFG